MFEKFAVSVRKGDLKAMMPAPPDALVPLPIAKAKGLVASHRGRALGGARDNTLEAFEQAIAGGAEMIEFDVRRTSDGVLVLNHDAKFAGRVVRSTTYEALQERPGGAELATLRQVVDMAQGRAILDVEIKEAGYEAETLEIVRAKFAPDQFVVTSFLDEVVAKVKRLAPDVCAGLLVGQSWMREMLLNKVEDIFPIGRVRRVKADFLACSFPLADIGVLQTAAIAGVPVVVWTVNDSWRLKRHLRDRHVAAVITDMPEKAVKHLKQI